MPGIMPMRPRSHNPAPRRPKQEGRPSAAKRGYGRSWQRASKAFLMEHPLCECQECKASGVIVAAEVVHHIVAHKGNQTLFWDESNWAALSKRCHDRLTAKEEGFGRNR